MSKLENKSQISSSPEGIAFKQTISADNEIIRLDRVSLRYDRDTDIFSDVSWLRPNGSLTFLTGPSGAGKTSLLRLIRCELMPGRGHVHLFGQDMTQARSKDIIRVRRQMGWVAQDHDLVEDLNIFENIALPLRVSGQGRAFYESDVADLMNWVGLGQRMNAYPASLSAGEKQRASIARAIIHRPKLLLADEPTGNVDPEMGKRLLRLFLELNRLGTTIIIATHDQYLLSQYPADVFKIHNKQIIPLRNADIL